MGPLVAGRRPSSQPVTNGSVLRRGVGRRHGGRGVGFLFFVLFGLLPIFFAGVLSFDLSRSYLARRQVQTAAEAAAVAGAQQYLNNTYALDQPRARTITVETLTRAVGAGVTYLSTPGTSVIKVTNLNTSVQPIWQVEVTVNYRVDGLVFSRALSTLTNAASGRSGYYDGSITRRAVVCTGQSYQTLIGLQYCPRPGSVTIAD